MKKIILTTILVLSAIAVQAQELDWQINVKEAAEKSIKENKPMIMFFTGSDWCVWCKRLVSDVFEKKEFKDWVNKKDIVLSVLDFPSNNKQERSIRAQNGFLKNLLKIRGFPTVVFTSPKKQKNGSINLNEIGRLGYDKSEKRWISNAEIILSRLKKKETVKK